MGALPKNKITRAERGKRRAGNTPTLTRDVAVSRMPLHKKSLATSILSSLGFSSEKADRTIHKRARRESLAATAPREEAAPAALTPANTPSDKSKHRAQHKG